MIKRVVFGTSNTDKPKQRMYGFVPVGENVSLPLIRQPQPSKQEQIQPTGYEAQPPQEQLNQFT